MKNTLKDNRKRVYYHWIFVIWTGIFLGACSAFFFIFTSNRVFGDLNWNTYHIITAGYMPLQVILSLRYIKSKNKWVKISSWMGVINPTLLLLVFLFLIFDYSVFDLKISKPVSLNTSLLIPSSVYKSFLNNYIEKKAKQEPKHKQEFSFNDIELAHVKWKTILSDISNKKVKDYLLYSTLYNQIDLFGIQGINKLLKQFKQQCQNKQYLIEIQELYNGDKNLRDHQKITIYKTINDIALEALIFNHEEIKHNNKRTAFLFFHGGGWAVGKPEWGKNRCEYYASLGMVAISFEYRIRDRHGTTPIESIKDAKSAIRWVRKNASHLGIDPDKIIACGFSAGGHLAACTAMIKGFEGANEDLTISSTPNALVLYSSPMNTSWMDTYVDSVVNCCSPFHHIKPELPPMILFNGTKDEQVSFVSNKNFAERMSDFDNQCEFHALKGRGHFIFNNKNDKQKIVKKTDEFLNSLGYLNHCSPLSPSN
jgi:acetyl esterase/lipase